MAGNAFAGLGKKTEDTNESAQDAQAGAGQTGSSAKGDQNGDGVVTSPEPGKSLATDTVKRDEIPAPTPAPEPEVTRAPVRVSLDTDTFPATLGVAGSTGAAPDADITMVHPAEGTRTFVAENTAPLAEDDDSSVHKYAHRQAVNFQMGDFIFENSVLTLTDEREQRKFAELLEKQPPAIKSQIIRIDRAGAEAAAKAAIAKQGSSIKQGMDSSDNTIG